MSSSQSLEGSRAGGAVVAGTTGFRVRARNNPMEEAGGGKPVGQRAGPGPAWRAGPPGVDDEGSPASCVVATLGRTSFGERVRRGLSTRAGTGSLSVRPRSTPCRRQRCARRNVLISFIDNDAEIDLDISISESRSLFLSIDGSIHIFIDRKRETDSAHVSGLDCAKTWRRNDIPPPATLR